MKDKVVFILLLVFLFSGCMDDEALWDFQKPDYPVISKGVFVVNEGNFMYGNASLSYYDIENKEVFNDVFYHTNALALGDVALSMQIRDGLGYIVVNNSGRIYIIDISTFEYKGKITGLTSPRYIHFVNDSKAYVTDLYARAIAVVDPQTHELKKHIDVRNQAGSFYQHSTEQMVSYGRFVFVNCWSFDNKILVIDSETDEWIDTIEVPIQPSSMVADKNGKIWVLTDGGFPGSPYGHEAPALVKIDAKTRQKELVYRFQMNDWPRSLVINGSKDTLYFINRHIYRHAVGDDTYPTLFIRSHYTNAYSDGFNGLGVDPLSSEVYVSDAIDRLQAGLVFRFRPDATPVDTMRVGIIPREFCFMP